MKKNAFLLLMLIASVFIFGCKSDEYIASERFVSKYEFEQFEEFKNIGIIKRGFDKNDPILLLNPSFSYNYNDGPIILTVDSKTQTIEQIDTKLNKFDTITFDTIRYQKLINKFMDYNIFRLEVDTNLTVLLSVKYSEKPNLVKFSDIKYKTKYYESWKKIKGLWFYKAE